MLRPYQEAMLGRIRSSIREGKRRLLIVSPTGSGKSYVIAHMLSEIGARFKTALVVSHRREIIYQLSDHLQSF
ncbi:MAG: DEAD/DEAH box helicase family protein, partial [bacterium]